MPRELPFFRWSGFQSGTYRPDAHQDLAYKMLNSWLNRPDTSCRILFEFFNPNQKVPEQTFTKWAHFVPQPASHFATAMMDVNTPLFRDCPGHNPTPEANDYHLAKHSNCQTWRYRLLLMLCLCATGRHAAEAPFAGRKVLRAPCGKRTCLARRAAQETTLGRTDLAALGLCRRNWPG